MNTIRPIGNLLLALESVVVGCKIVVHGPGDLSFATQAMRLLMFCTRYLDLYWIQYDPPMRSFLLLSTLTVVILLGYKKCSQDAHMNISHGTTREVTSILLFSAALGAAFMYAPTILEFFWTFSRFIDIVVEVPQLKIVYASEKIDKWIIVYYCCIGSQVFLYTLRAIYTYCDENVIDIITAFTTISKGIAIATFFVVRFFNHRGRQPVEDQKESVLDSDTSVHQHTNEKTPVIVVSAPV